MSVEQEVSASAEQIGAGEVVSQVRLDIRIGEGVAHQTINIGALYSGPIHFHVSLDLGVKES